jgi:Flp pilus assembly pilin Flp
MAEPGLRQDLTSSPFPPAALVNAMRQVISRFPADSDGSAMLEYALIVSAIAIAILSPLSSLGETLGTLYQTIISGLASVGGSAV